MTISRLATASLNGATNTLKHATSNPSLRNSMQNFAQPRLPGQSNRPISTVSTPTTFNSQGKVQSPGHIQYKTSPEEQEEYDLDATYGHSPNRKADPSRPPLPPVGVVKGNLPDGTPFKVQGVKSYALPFNKDKPIIGGKVTDHGKLTPEQAAILKEHQASPTYETSGRDEENCVHEYGKVAQKLGFLPPGQIPKHMTPDGMAKLTENARTDNS